MNHRLGTVLLIVAALSGCTTYAPVPLADVPFAERAQSETRRDVTVTVSVLSQDEAQDAYGVKLYKKNIQPVWVEIENRSGDRVLFLPRGVDPDYVPALEAAYRSHKTWRKKTNRRIDTHFYEQQLQLDVPPGETVSGFVLGTKHLGARLVTVDLLAEDWQERFEFVLEIPGFRADYHKAIETYRELVDGEGFVDLDKDGLREWIESQVCCTSNAAGTKTGDPLNIVVIGSSKAVWPAFLRAGWDVTEIQHGGSVFKTGIAGIFGGRYRYAPISSLYVFGRPQDIALQKSRHNIHLRNHLRLWRAPVDFKGLPVWFGQISRDIGTRLTTKSPTLTTHKIDPDVDETRGALAQDFIYVQSLGAIGAVGGVGAAPSEAPRGNLTGDPYFTDGRRLVMVLSEEIMPVLDIEFIDFEPPPADDGGAD